MYGHGHGHGYGYGGGVAYAIVVSAPLAMVRQPARSRFVSLRATAADRAGNAVEETVIRAYVLR